MAVKRIAAVITLGLLFIMLTSCAVLERLQEVELPEGIAETVEVAAKTAAEAAGTAVSQAGDFAQTAIVVATEEGSEAVATFQARSTPDLDVIRDKFAFILPGNDGSFSVSISDSDLNRLLAFQQLVTGPDDFSPLNDVAVAFTSGVIFLTGDTVYPVESRLKVSFRPEIVDGQFQFEVLTAHLGDQEAPQSVYNSAETALNASLGEAVERLPDGYKLREITVSEGLLTVSGGRQ